MSQIRLDFAAQMKIQATAFIKFLNLEAQNERDRAARAAKASSEWLTSSSSNYNPMPGSLFGANTITTETTYSKYSTAGYSSYSGFSGTYSGSSSYGTFGTGSAYSSSYGTSGGYASSSYGASSGGTGNYGTTSYGSFGLKEKETEEIRPN